MGSGEKGFASNFEFVFSKRNCPASFDAAADRTGSHEVIFSEGQNPGGRIARKEERIDSQKMQAKTDATDMNERSRSSAHRAGLDTAHVIRAAAEMVDKRGLKSLKLSDLAEYLGVRAPSLYSHIGGIPELRRELQLMSLKKMEKCLSWALAGRERDAAVMALAQSYRDFATKHPGLYEIMMRPIDKADEELEGARLEVVRIARACLVGYSLSEDDEWHVIRAIRSVVHGFVSLESDGHFERPIDENESFRRLIAMIIDGIAGLKKKEE